MKLYTITIIVVLSNVDIKVALALTLRLPDIHQDTPHLRLIDARPETISEH